MSDETWRAPQSDQNSSFSFFPRFANKKPVYVGRREAEVDVAKVENRDFSIRR